MGGKHEVPETGNTDLERLAHLPGLDDHGEPNRGNHAWTLPEESSRPLLKQALEAGINFSTPPTAIPTAAARRSSAGRAARPCAPRRLGGRHQGVFPAE